MNLLPVDVVQIIGLKTHSTKTYLNLALCCGKFSKLLQKPRRKGCLQHFTHIIHINDIYGRTEWRINGKLHREDGPAIEYSNGNKSWKSWYLNGKLHREDGPTIEWADGRKEWYRNGELHREDGPAREYDGWKEWYRNGNIHREDGPAIECSSGDKYWYVNGKLIGKMDQP